MRNLGVSLARGEYVILTVQDAVPLDERWLSAMVENLGRDERVLLWPAIRVIISSL
jgi:rhamnosyltransferase